MLNTCHMNFRSCIIIVSALVATSALADDREEFNTAYASYQHHINAKDNQQALPAAAEAYRLGTKVFGRKSMNTANLAINYATLLNDIGDFKEARKTLKGKLKYMEQYYGENSTDLIAINIQLALADKKPEASLEYLERAASLSKGYENSLVEAQVNFDILTILLKRGGQILGEPYVDRAYAIFSEKLQPNDFRLGFMSFHKALWATQRNHHGKALDYLNGALTAFVSTDGKQLGDLERTVRTQLVATLQQLDQPDTATEHCLVLGAHQDWSPKSSLVYRQDPVFPPEAFENEIEGQVTLLFTVDENGYVVDPKITESNQTIYNDTALEMVAQFRYAPRFVSGNPMATNEVEYIANFAFDRPIASRSNFQRPPLRGFATTDKSDTSRCSENSSNSDLIGCPEFGSLGGK